MIDLDKLEKALPPKDRHACIHHIPYEDICRACLRNCDADVFLGIIHELLQRLKKAEQPDVSKVRALR